VKQSNVRHVTSPAPSASAVTPEQLAVAARALGGVELHWWNGAWWLSHSNEYRIGSDADLFDKLLDTMQFPRVQMVQKHPPLWTCNSDWLNERFAALTEGPTKLAAVIACIAAMGAT
jgi:hypothetical protein